MRFWLLCSFICLSVISNAQNFHSFFQLDSIKMNYRIGGELDSIDQIIGVQSTTLPGGGWNTTENVLPSDFLIKFNGGQRFYDYTNWKPMRFSGLPHIGFAYSFGSKGTQFAKAEYQQVFGKNFLLNIDFTKYRSNGFIRNSDFSYNDVQLQLNRKARVYSFELKGSYKSSDIAQSNGLVIDTLANDYDLIFLPVKKENARSNTKLTKIYLANYFDLVKDSSKAMGFFTQHELSIKKYQFTEDDTLYGIYNTINFDSLMTYDQHQWSQIANGAGVFAQNRLFFIKGGITAEYWNFQNLGRFNDTTEFSLFGDLNFKRNKTLVSNQVDLNLIGAKNEFYNHFEVTQRLNTLLLRGIAHFESKLPDYHQRYAIGNTYQLNSTVPELQQRINLSAQIEVKLGFIDLKGSYKYSMVRNNYFFIQDSWRNDTLTNLSFNQLNVRAEYRYKALCVQPSYILTLNPGNFNVLPQHHFQMRLMVQGGLFKAKKLKAYTGVDFAMISSYQRLGFTPMTSTFNPAELSSTLNGYNNLHFFTGFQIDEFKFFIRMENLAYLWSDRNITQQLSYPISSMQFRIGITWDFFN